MIDNSCQFCDDIRSVRGGENIFVFRSESIVIIADFAPIALGHILISPRDHVTSLANASTDVRAEAFRVAGLVSEAFGLRGYSTLMAEHGTGESGCPSNACCEHAHLHLVPLNFAGVEDRVFSRYLASGRQPLILNGVDELVDFEGRSYNLLQPSDGILYV